MPTVTPKKKQPTRRERTVSLLIRCLCAREGIKTAQTASYLLPSERRRALDARTADLAAAQFELEKLLFKTTRADHLDGVDKVYGLKRRELRCLKPASGLAAQPVAA